MKIFEINDIVPTPPVTTPVTPATYVSDFFARFGGFWKSLVLRNQDQSFSCSYRMGQTHPWKTLRPFSERPIQGWGSYFEITSAAVTPNIEIDYIGVLKRNATQE